VLAEVKSSRWEQHLQDQQDASVTELIEFLRIPSVSTDPVHNADVAKAAEWVVARLKRAGVPEVQYLATNGHPIICGRWHISPDAPTVLIYGHYDVQPPEPLDLWETSPFEPAIRGDKLYARGAADMKGNLLATIHAVEALAKETGQPPLNVTYIFEGEEEVGSPNLQHVVAAERELLKCDFALSADGGMKAQDKPSLTIAYKGIASCQINLRTGSTDLHSGGFGAFVPNAVQAMSQLAATFHNPDGSVAVLGFYDEVRPLTDDEREELAASGVTDLDLLRMSGANGLWGEPGYTALERQGARPTLDFNGMWGGFEGKGSKTVTPCEAHLKITTRLVADQDPEHILDLVEQHVGRHVPQGSIVTITRHPGSAAPFLLERTEPALQKAFKVLASVYGKDPIFVRAGGTVPITAVFQKELGRETVSLGFAMPDSRAHAPNEWYSLNDFAIARRSLAAYFAELAVE
jgi:acetylornithine deacetylase/succinyl-diaminopimelate desuccinylase-like protein